MTHVHESKKVSRKVRVETIRSDTDFGAEPLDGLAVPSPPNVSSGIVEGRSRRVEALVDREAEATLLMKAAAMLKHVQTHWSSPDREQALEKALKFNQKLWTFFQASLLEESNPLPTQLKENILRLSAFVDRKTFEIMAYPTCEKLDILIGIDTNIAAGLKTRGS